jgi:hypothetical protein
MLHQVCHIQQITEVLASTVDYLWRNKKCLRKFSVNASSRGHLGEKLEIVSNLDTEIEDNGLM